MMLKLLAIDFDGVIRSDSDAPVPGALESLRFLMTRYCVYIFTASKVPEVANWLEGHGFKIDQNDNGSPSWETQGVLLVTNRKLDAAAFVDNKAIRFWDWISAIAEIERLA